MSNHNFKVGDKVKISIEFPVHYDRGKICIITDIKSAENCFAYEIKEEGTAWVCPVYEDEIEPVIKVGQQLLFSFMNKVT